MHYKLSLKDYVFLFLAAYTSFATSELQTSLDRGSYAVSSDCPDAKLKQGLAEVGSQPGDYRGFSIANAADFGFPGTVFSLGDSTSKTITVTGASGSCKGLAFEASAAFTLFACYDPGNSSIKCTITLQRK